MIQAILGFLGGPIARQLRGAYSDRLSAQTTEAKLAADERIKVLEGAQQIARIEAADRWSATRIGRLLIVVPFGIWWSAIFIDSIFSASWDVLALPPDIMDMAKILIPAILIADAGALVARRFGRT